jgi:hypothetical protein
MVFSVPSVVKAFQDLTQRGGAATKSVKIIYQRVLPPGATFLRATQRIYGLVVQRAQEAQRRTTEKGGLCVGYAYEFQYSLAFNFLRGL